MTPQPRALGSNEVDEAPAGAPRPPATPSKRTPDEPQQSPHNGDDTGEEEEGEEDEEDTEPKLKYARLTASLGPAYRNGDATSSSLVAGDKLILGTHNGNIHVFSIPTFQTLRTYKAHNASVNAVSASPFPPPWPHTKREGSPRPAPDSSRPTAKQDNIYPDSASPRSSRQQQLQIPATPSNSIYIATASIDGNVCVSSLVDPKDVQLRNFGRPVQAVALSPEYKNDRTYVSGGKAGQLILTVGGKIGVSANANTSSAAAAAQGWLGSIGLGNNTGRDTPLHSGEGPISLVKWSLTGRFVLWVNEQGIKIMRSHLKLNSEHLDDAWKRIGHIDKPNRKIWQEMASAWRPKVEWIDDDHLEVDEPIHDRSNGSHISPPPSTTNASESLAKFAHSNARAKKRRSEKAVIGWGDTAWVVVVKPEGSSSSSGNTKHADEWQAGSADIVHKLLFDDCIISGISLYTPSLMVILAYRTRDDNDKPIQSTTEDTPRRGKRQKQDGLQPELRLIEAASGSEVDVDTLTFSRFETLTAADYHLNTLYVPPITEIGPLQRGALQTINSAFWDAGASTARLFSSGASILSVPTSNEKSKTAPSQDSLEVGSPKRQQPLEPNKNAASAGVKIFIQSPYDCVLAVKREPSDHLDWLLQHAEYEKAYELLDSSPQILGDTSLEPARSASVAMSPTLTPKNHDQRSLADFFADDSASQTTTSAVAAQTRAHFSSIEKEKRRIGELWLEQLVSDQDYHNAGRIAGRVLGTSTRWEHWVLKFAEAGKHDDIAEYVPAGDVRPPLPSLVYEVILGHYIAYDRVKFKEYLDKWDPPTYDVGSVISAVEAKLRAGESGEDLLDKDWEILMEGLARLYLADGRPKDALKCYIRVQNADEAIRLIRDLHLLGDISDDIPGFLLLRISKAQMSKASLDELEEAASEPLGILVDEAYTGVLLPSTVVRQLQAQSLQYQPFLFFYLRALWTGHLRTKTAVDQEQPRTRRRGQERLLVEGRTMVEEFGDLAVDLFAEYDREVLMHFLRNATSYDYTHASTACEQRNYIPELVYLLSKTGQTKRALQLITEKMADPTMAITFAKEQHDKELWSDLLDYSMDASDPKPRFIRALLAEAGTSIDPITLVKRIPEGLEVEGLRDGIQRLVREFEIQGSISEGVAKVLRGEVAAGLELLRSGRRRGVKFEVLHEDTPQHLDVSVNKDASMIQPTNETEKNVVAGGDLSVRTQATAAQEDQPQPGHCVGCHKVFAEDENETLIGFACGHVYHLSCLLSRAAADGQADNDGDKSNTSAAVGIAQKLQERLARDATDEESGSFSRSVGAKTAHARIIGSAVGRLGCLMCRRAEDEV